MAVVEGQWPECGSREIVEYGRQANDEQRYRCNNLSCQRKFFLLQYHDKGRVPEVKRQMVEMALNGSGIRDTARVLRISLTTVIAVLKKCMVCPCESTLYLSESSKRQPTAVMYPASVRDYLSPEP